MNQSRVRQDVVLEDLITHHNYSQALKHVSKKLKKSPNDVYLHISKAICLHKAHDYAAALSMCSSLAESAIPVDDLSQLSQIHQLLAAMGCSFGYAQCLIVAENMWKKVLKSRPNNTLRVHYAKEWARISIASNQWGFVSQAASAVQTNLPKGDPQIRQYHFWQIVGLWLNGQSFDAQDKMADMSSRLASGLVERALKEMSPTGPPQGSSINVGKSIGSWSEFGLVEAIMTTNNGAKLCEILREKGLGDTADAILHPWRPMNAYTRALLLSGQPFQASKFFQDVLQIARERDIRWMQENLVYWQSMARLAHVSGDELLVKEVEKYMADFLKSLGTGELAARSARIAFMHHITQQLHKPAIYDSSEGSAAMRQAVTMHVGSFLTSPTFVADITRVPEWTRNMVHEDMRSFTNEKVKTFLTSYSNHDQLRWLTAEANSLALDFERLRIDVWEPAVKSLGLVNDCDQGHPLSVAPFVLGHPQRCSDQSPTWSATKAKLIEQVECFAACAIRLFKVSRSHTASLPKTEVDPGNKALRLAAEALSFASVFADNQSTNLIAASLLQSMLEASRFDHESRKVLITLLQFSGLNSLAAKAYEQLRVKGVLNDPCCPGLFTRIGAYHPFPVQGFDIYAQMGKALRFYADSIAAVPVHQTLALEQENYATVLKIQQLRSAVSDSFTRRLLICERRRIARLTSVSHQDENLRLDTDPPSDVFSDNGPWTHSSRQTLLPNCGPKFGHSYIKWLSAVDEILEQIMHAPMVPIKKSDDIGTRPTMMLQQLYGPSCSLSVAERNVHINLLLSMHRAWTQLWTEPVQWSSEHHQVLDALKIELKEFTARNEAYVKVWNEEISKVQQPTWQMLELLFLEHDLLKAVHIMLSKASSALKNGKHGNTAETRKCESIAVGMQTMIRSVHDSRRHVVLWRWNWVQEHYENGKYFEDVFGTESKEDASLCHSLPSSQMALALIGPTKAAKILGSFVESGQDALEGFLKLKSL